MGRYNCGLKQKDTEENDLSKASLKNLVLSSVSMVLRVGNRANLSELFAYCCLMLLRWCGSAAN